MHTQMITSRYYFIPLKEMIFKMNKSILACSNGKPNALLMPL